MKIPRPSIDAVLATMLAVMTVVLCVGVATAGNRSADRREVLLTDVPSHEVVMTCIAQKNGHCLVDTFDFDGHTCVRYRSTGGVACWPSDDLRPEESP